MASDSALCMMPAGLTPTIEDGKMKTRRLAYWWLRFVVSGRFLAKFLNSRQAKQTERPAATTRELQ
jgi:hypothetical protein